MSITLTASKFGFSVVLASMLVVGCGTSSTPIAQLADDTELAASQPADGSSLPLLALPGPDDNKTPAGKGKVTKASTSGKSGSPTLLPRLFGKKDNKDKDQDKNDTPVETPADSGIPAQKTPEKGSPEWLLVEIQRVRILPLPHEALGEDEGDEDSDEEEKPLTPAQEKKLEQEIARNKAIRRERNLQIVKLAEECIQKTNKNPQFEPQFASAVHHLLDARLQLALQGDDESMKAIYEADKVFFDRDPKSEPAAEASLTLVNLTHANAIRYGKKDPRWLKEFSKATQSYANRFPDEAPRSIPLLMAAARSCEMNGQPDEAQACYLVLSSKFQASPQGQQASNTLRRLSLKGQELELAGATIDGGFANVKEMKGKMVLVVYWASNAQPFLQHLPKIQEITTKYKNYLTVVGVNLDVDEAAVDSFAEANKLDWVQIFPEDKANRGWNSPLAVQYGVNMLPTMFLTNPNGIVTEVHLDATNLEQKIRETYAPFRTKAAAK